MADEPARPVTPGTSSERRLAIAASGVAVLLVLAALPLWMHYGQSVYTSRILNMIANCL
jgi:hypothetical protein